jgi:hypothetical protein
MPLPVQVSMQEGDRGGYARQADIDAKSEDSGHRGTAGTCVAQVNNSAWKYARCHSTLSSSGSRAVSGLEEREGVLECHNVNRMGFEFEYFTFVSVPQVPAALVVRAFQASDTYTNPKQRSDSWSLHKTAGQDHWRSSAITA